MKRFSILLLLLSLSFAGFGQQADVRSLLINVSKVYHSAKSVSMKLQVDYFSEEKMTKPEISYKGEVMISGSNYYSSFMGRKLVVNKNWMVLIDQNEKAISCMKPIDPKAAGIDLSSASSPAALADSLLKKNKGIKLLANDAEGNKVLEVKNPDPVYKRIEMHINPSTYAITRIDFFYNTLEEGAAIPKVIAYYKDVRFNLSIPEETFSEKKYIVKQGGGWKVSAAYSGYELFDYTTPKTIGHD